MELAVAARLPRQGWITCERDKRRNKTTRIGGAPGRRKPAG